MIMLAISLSFLLIFSLIYADPCPDGYTQAPNGGNCFKAKSYYDWFINQYVAKTFDEVESDCNKDGGGMLASIHSKEENDFIRSLWVPCELYWLNIGIRCTGGVCKWDDGSLVTYTNFEGGKYPIDDGGTQCFGMYDPSTEWRSRGGCGKEMQQCWLCSVKATTIECVNGETAYKGGCLSVHTSPLNQTDAETSCPGGGHLVSIHSYIENNFYAQMALNAGATGTVYIGGRFSNGVFEWTDGSNYNDASWANAFPNTIFGNCVQLLLSSEFGVLGQWTNIDCNVKQPYMCFRS